MHFSTRFISAIALCSTAIVMSAADPVCQWGHFFDGATTAGDNGTAIVGTADGAFWFNILGSTASDTELTYAGQKIFDGAPDAALNNGNFDITKTAADGSALWTVYSNSGDFASNQGGMAVTADGSIVFAAKVRHSSSMLDKPVTFVDAKGKAFNIGGTVTDRYYFGVVGCITADGEIKWLRQIEVDHGTSPDGSKTLTADAITISTPVFVDGKVFVGGNFRMPLHFVTKSGEQILQPRNVAAWNGDSQKSAGGMFIASFDTDGYYLGALTPSGADLTSEQISDMTVSGSTVYFTGIASSAEGTSATLGGKTLSAGTSASPFTGAFSAANPDALSWLSCTSLEAVNKKSGYQNPKIAVAGSTLWLTGMFNGTITDAASGKSVSQSETGTLREGLIIKYDSATGSWLNAAASHSGLTGIEATALTGYMGALQNSDHPEHVYIYGYGMNKAVGVFLRGYDAETLSYLPDNSWTLVTSTAAPSALAISYIPEKGTAYATVRTNAALTPVGADTTPAPKKWAVYAAEFSLPDDLHSGVESVTTTEAAISVTATFGGLNITAPAGTTVIVCDIAGRVAASVSADGQTVFTPLSAGIYIANGKKYIVR